MNIVVSHPDLTPKITVSSDEGSVNVQPSAAQTVTINVGIVGERGPEGPEPALVDGGTFN